MWDKGYPITLVWKFCIPFFPVFPRALTMYLILSAGCKLCLILCSATTGHWCKKDGGETHPLLSHRRYVKKRRALSRRTLFARNGETTGHARAPSKFWSITDLVTDWDRRWSLEDIQVINQTTKRSYTKFLWRQLQGALVLKECPH